MWRPYKKRLIVGMGLILSACTFSVSNEQILKSSWKVCDGVPSIGDGFNGQSLHLHGDTIYRQDKPYAMIMDRTYELFYVTSWNRLTIQNIENQQVGVYCNK